jgi:hypothetical protein
MGASLVQRVGTDQHDSDADRSDFGFDDNRGRFVVEPGAIDLYAGDSSPATLTRSFTVR